MNLISKILCYFYLIIRSIGFKIKPFKFFFNKPNIKIYKTLHIELTGSEEFNLKERKLILEALDEIYHFTNERIKFNISFNLNEISEEQFANQPLIIKIDSNYQIVKDSDKCWGLNTIGLCYFRNNNAHIVYLIHDRLEIKWFKTTVIHELFHLLGLKHTKRLSIMQPINTGFVLHPTYKDAVEMAKILNCMPKDLKYFKI